MILLRPRPGGKLPAWGRVRGVGAGPWNRTSEADLVGACHDIVNAASSLLINLESLARSDSDQAVVEDSRRSIRVVADLALAIRRAIEAGTLRDKRS